MPFQGESGTIDALDPALTRRFDRSIMIDLPNAESRNKIFHLLLDGKENIQVSNELIDNLTSRSIGMSPADIESAIETAIREAIRAETILNDDIVDESFEKYNNGDEKKWSSSELLRTARHEAGHAFICNYYGEKPSYLTIVARKNHGGYMMHADEEEKGVYTKKELEHKICTSLGGRAAELVYYGNEDGLTSGPSSDLAQATKIANSMLAKYGMDDEFGISALSEKQASSNETIKKQVDYMLKEQLQTAINIIKDNQTKVDVLVNELMKKNHLTEKEIQAILV